MTFADAQPIPGQEIRVRWQDGEWIDYGTLSAIATVGPTPNESWLLSSDRYQNSVVRYYDQWEIKT